MIEFLDSLGTVGLVVASLVFDVTAWCGILIFVSRMSGWHALAKRFRWKGQFNGGKWRLQEAPTGHQNYYG
jgi:hypothetical protein